MKQMPATPEPSRSKSLEPHKELIWRSSRFPSSKHAVPAPEFSHSLPAKICSTGPISTPPIKKPMHPCRLNYPKLIQEGSSSGLASPKKIKLFIVSTLIRSWTISKTINDRTNQICFSATKLI